MKKWFRSDNFHFLFFFILSLLAVYTFKSGFIFSLDGPLNTPHLNYWLSHFQNTYFTHAFYLFFALPQIFYIILPGWIIQRLLFFVFPLYLLGLAGYHLVDSEKKIPRYFAGIFMICNPMVYDRMLDGQVGVVLGLAFFVFFLRALKNYGDSAERRAAVITSVLGAVAIICSPHNIFFIGGSLVLFFLFYVRHIGFKKIMVDYVLMGSIILLLNLNWVVGNFVGTGGAAASKTESIESMDYTAFRTLKSDKTNIFFNTAGMHGYWGENQGRFMTVRKKTQSYWKPLMALIMGIALFGALSQRRNKDRRRFVRMLMVFFPIALILAIGVSDNWTKPITMFMYDHVPFYKGMREPHKWVGMLLVIYAYLGALGVEKIMGGNLYRRKVLYPLIGVVLCSLPILYTPTIFFAFSGQLKPVDYYETWYEVNDFLNEDEDDFQALFLPWHQYIRFYFSGKLFDNPAEKFFEKEVIRGDNIEFLPYIYSQSNRPESKYIESFIRHGEDREKLENFGEKLKQLNVKYVLLAREVDWQGYRFLARQDDLEVVKDVKSMIVYKNLAWGPEDKQLYEEMYPQHKRPMWLFITTVLLQIGAVGGLGFYFWSSRKKKDIE